MSRLGEEREGALLVYGSPLLDIIVNHPSAAELLDKFDLKPDNSVFAEDKHLPLYDEVEEKWKEHTQYIVGGTSLNVARTVQWLVGKPGVVTFCGGVGTDRHGAIVQQQTHGAGVHALFHLTDALPTGTCLTVCTGHHRSMVSRMAGAGSFTVEELHQPHHWSFVEQASFFYTVSFSLANNPEVLLRLARHAAERKKTFCLNLSAPFLSRRYKESMCRLLPFVHFLFGNQSGDKGAVAKALAAWPLEDQSRPRTVVITNGSNPVLVATETTVTEYPVPCVDPNDIVDTSGAGDAFVGGFLTQLLRHQSVAECVNCALYASGVVLQHPGCSFPPSVEYPSHTSEKH
ncbi:hypothetical protein ACOMHN_057197 [Nucella lapillus]